MILKGNQVQEGKTYEARCPACLTEFEICLEPIRRGEADITTKKVKFCPFCASTVVIVIDPDSEE